MKIAMVILARKGSIRIPDKNIRLFAGKPLIEYTLEFIQNFEYEKYIYTDSDEIKEISKKYNVNIRNKKFENEKGIHNTRKELIEYNKEIKADVIILLQATSPLRNIELSQIWIDEFLEYDFDCGISAYPLENRYLYDKNGIINYDVKERDYNGCIKQPIYIENGSFYIFKKEQLKKRHIVNGKIMICFDKYNIDLDSVKDWEKAELLYKAGLL